MLRVERPFFRSRVPLAHFIVAALVASVAVIFSPVPSSAAETALYVSPSGDDGGNGSVSSPFRTIERARDVVRTMNADMTGDVTVYLRGGSYPIADTIRFDALDSGTNGHRVVYSAYRGETPVLEAGVAVSGWTQHDGSIWKAALDRESKLRALYVDGTRAIMARKTVTSAGCYGTYSVTAGQAPWAWESGSECDGAKYALTDVPAIAQNQQDIELQTQTTWTTAITGIREVTTTGDGSQRAVMFQQPGAAIAQGAFNGDLQDSGSHILSNAYEFLDEPGEFFYDRTAQTVYLYKKPTTNLATASVYAPNNLETVISVSGATTTQRARDLTFTGITIRHSDWNLTQVEGSSFKQAQQGNLANIAYARKNFHEYHYRNVQVQPGAVEVSNASGIEFVGNRVEHTGSDGIQFLNDVVDSRIEGNVTNDIGGSALNIGDPQHVYIGDGTPENGERYSAAVEGAPTDIAVRNNYFRESAVLFWGSAVISGYFLDTVAIENNRIDDAPWAGVSMGWGWKDFDGDPSSIEPGNPTTVARNNSIQRNEIRNTMQNLSDSAPIYTLGNQPGTVIDDNYINGIRPGHTYGLHPDEGSANISYDHNVLEISSAVTDVIHSGTWGRQNSLQIRNTFGPINSIFDSNVPNSVIEDIRVVPDFGWPTEAYDVIVAAGVAPEFRGILGSLRGSADYALPASIVVTTSAQSIPIRGVGDSASTIWLAPAGTTTFVAGERTASAPGDATTIPVPQPVGNYKLFVIDKDGAASAASAATVTRTLPAPRNEKLTQVESQRCLDLSGAATSNGSRPGLWTCQGDPNQRFTYTPDQEIRVYGNKCLDANYKGTTPGTHVVIWDCNGGTNQKWTLNADGSILGQDSQLCLSTISSGQAELATCTGVTRQRWDFPVTASTIPAPESAVTVTPTVSSDAGEGTTGWHRGTASVTFAVDSPDLTVQYRLNGAGEWLAAPHSVSVSAQGTSTVAYRAIRLSGLVAAGSEGSVDVNVDSVAPVSSAASNPASGVVEAGETVSAVITATDATSGVLYSEYSLDNGGTWIRATETGVAFTEVGRHGLLFRSVDVAGNTGIAKSIVLTIAAPQTTANASITSADAPSAEGWYQQNVLVKLTAPKVGQKIQYRINGGTWKAYSASIAVSAGGTTVIEHRVLESNVVVPHSTAEVHVKVDKSVPVVSATRTPSGGAGTPRNPISVSFTGSDVLSGLERVEYRINSGEWTVRGADSLVLGEVGDYVVTYRAVDRAGNVSQTKSLTVIIGADKPATVKTSVAKAKPGSIITLSITGFNRWDDVSVEFAGSSLTTVLTDQNGAARVSVKVPAGAGQGAAPIVVTGSGGATATTILVVTK